MLSEGGHKITKMITQGLQNQFRSDIINIFVSFFFHLYTEIVCVYFPLNYFRKNKSVAQHCVLTP